MVKRQFPSLASFTRYIGEAAAKQTLVMRIASSLSADVMLENAKNVIGDSTKLASLAPSTQAERTRKGYSANDPLFRDGTLLRASLTKESFATATEGTAVLGSTEKVMAYHEWGYVNARTGTSVPPRPAMHVGAKESLPEIDAITTKAISVGFGFSSPLAIATLKDIR